MEAGNLTPIEERMLKILSDGKPHSKAELHGCVYTGALDNVGKHVSNIRKKILPLGQDIALKLIRRKLHYQHVIIMNSALAE